MSLKNSQSEVMFFFRTGSHSSKASVDDRRTGMVVKIFQAFSHVNAGSRIVDELSMKKTRAGLTSVTIRWNDQENARISRRLGY